jgi:hypothetical protein
VRLRTARRGIGVAIGRRAHVRFFGDVPGVVISNGYRSAARAGRCRCIIGQAVERVVAEALGRLRCGIGAGHHLTEIIIAIGEIGQHHRPRAPIGSAPAIRSARACSCAPNERSRARWRAIGGDFGRQAGIGIKRARGDERHRPVGARDRQV